MDLDREQLTEAFNYLDNLRESGQTNMMGAAAYVRGDLGYERKEANDVTMAWMQSFDGESTVEQRVEKVMAQG